MMIYVNIFDIIKTIHSDINIIDVTDNKYIDLYTSFL